MKKASIDDAYELARRFMERIENMRTEEKSRISTYEGHTYHNESPKHRGAVKRASMELTRALADLRRSDS